MTQPLVQWTTPAPLWAEATRAEGAAASLALHQPAILRFASDAFMDEFLALLEADPARLGELRARPETWRGPAEGAAAVKRLPPYQRALERRRLALERRKNPLALAGTQPSTTGDSAVGDAETPKLKLYQPAHQRFYLVATCLVCGVPGLPDRTLDTGNGERATFVVRRLRSASGDPAARCDLVNCDEYAFVGEGRGAGWQKIDDDRKILMPEEEQLPLFGVTFNADDGRRRRLLAGMVPIGKREAYIGAPERVAPEHAPATPDPRQIRLRAEVTEPWKIQIDLAAATKEILDSPDPLKLKDTTKILRETREGIQIVSWYILLDFAAYLKRYLKKVWAAIGDAQQEGLLSNAETLVLDELKKTTIDTALAKVLIVGTHYDENAVIGSLPAALLAADATGVGDKLERVVDPYNRTALENVSPSSPWPGFLFPLADPTQSTLQPPPGQTARQKAEALKIQLDHLVDLIDAALREQPATSAPPAPLAAQPVLDPRGGDWFVIRCVFERPNCGPLTGPLVSDPTAAFQIAGFFDPDAPARPIRIGLPVDISPAGLRKFDKNTAFMISDMLCGQIDRMKGMTLGDLVLSVLPWPFHKDLPGTAAKSCPEGMICSLSIPIITICALLLLIIIVALLDLIFHWLPFFLICFPLPKFRAKESG